MITPCWILVVGAAAAGKTTLARHIQERLPAFRRVSDLDALQQLFVKCGCEPGQEREAFEGSVAHWPELTGSATRLEGIRHLPDGGYDIVDPHIWDEALRRVVRDQESNPYVILEFARGTDAAYLALHSIVAPDVYAPSFRIIEEELRPSGVQQLILVNVHAPYELRKQRNDERRRRGEHFVAEAVMQSIYFDDSMLRSLSNIPASWKSHIDIQDLDTSINTTKAMERLVAQILAVTSLVPAVA